MKSAANQYPSQIAPKFNVRFPEGMREKIAKLAEANGRSMNAEILIRLKESMSMDIYAVDKNSGGYIATASDSDLFSIDARRKKKELMTIIRALSEEEQDALLLILKK